MRKKDAVLRNAHGIRRDDVFFGALNGYGPCEWCVSAVGGHTVFFVAHVRGGQAAIKPPQVATVEYVQKHMKRTRKAK